MTRANISEVRDAVVDAGALSPDGAGLPGTDAESHAQVVARLQSADLDDWAKTAARVGFCSSPVRLVGRAIAVTTPAARWSANTPPPTSLVASHSFGAATDEPTGARRALGSTRRPRAYR